MSSVKQAHMRKDNTQRSQATDSEDPLFKIEEVSSVETLGKQFNAKVIFSDLEDSYFTEL